MKKTGNQCKTIKIPAVIHTTLKKIAVEQGNIPIYAVISVLLLNYYRGGREIPKINKKNQM